MMDERCSGLGDLLAVIADECEREKAQRTEVAKRMFARGVRDYWAKRYDVKAREMGGSDGRAYDLGWAAHEAARDVAHEAAHETTYEAAHDVADT